MKLQRSLGLVFTVLSAALLMGAADGSWLHRVSSSDHARINPLLATSESRQKAASAGAQVFHNECAKCHGDDGGGLHNRPPVISDRVDTASDGDLFWLMNNGVPWRGMPPWISLPPGERWQLVAYLRALNVAEAGPSPLSATTSTARSAPSPQGVSR